jgi:hypothetical protein
MGQSPNGARIGPFIPNPSTRSATKRLARLLGKQIMTKDGDTIRPGSPPVTRAATVLDAPKNFAAFALITVFAPSSALCRDCP